MFDDDLNECAALVQRGDPDRFLATMAAPVAARSVLFPLYAFNVEVARAPWMTQEPMIAEMRLQWWRDALGEIAVQGEVRRHNVTTPLAKLLSPTQAKMLIDLVNARRWDIHRDAFESVDDFNRYIDATAGHLMVVAGHLLGATDDAPLRNLGCASGIAGWLRAVPELEASGRIPLVDGRPQAVAQLAQDALAQLRAAKQDQGKVPRAARLAGLAAWMAGPVLKQAAQTPERVKEGSLGLSEFSKKSRLMWQAAIGRW